MDINRPHSDRGPPLYSAAARGHDAIVQFLLESNAEIEGEGPFGTAIKAAACGGHMTTVGLLLEHGADVNACNTKEGTAVADAARKDRIPMILLLLVQAEALYPMLPSGRAKRLKLLLEHGALVEVNSINALEAAIDRGREDIVRTILHHAVDLDHALASPTVKAAEKGNNEFVDLLLEQGADINSVTERQQKNYIRISPRCFPRRST